MNADEARRILTLSNHDLDEVIKILPSGETMSFFSNLSHIEQKTFFKKANPLSAVKILCSLTDELAIETILLRIDPREAVAIGNQLWPHKREKLIKHAKDKDKRRLHSLLCGNIKVHRFDKTE